MKFPSQLLPATSIGIDLGTETIKLIVFKKNKNKCILEHAFIEPIPSPDKNQPRQKLLADLLSKIISENNITATRAIISFTGDNLFYQHDYFPEMKREDLIEAIRWKYKDQVGFPVQTAFIDFTILREVYEEDVKHLECLVILAASEKVMSIIEIVQAAGLAPVRISLAPFGCEAYYRQFLFTGRRSSTPAPTTNGVSAETVVWLEMGAKITQLSVLKDGHLDFARQLGFGCEQFSAALAQAPAELFVAFTPSSQGVHSPATKSKAQTDTISSQERLLELDFSQKVSSAVTNTLDILVQEVIRSLAYYRDKVGFEKVEKVIISGGVAELKGIAPALSAALNLPVEKAEAEKYVQHAADSRVVPLIGQLLVKNPNSPNLLPATIKEKLALIQLKAPSTITLAAVGLFLLAVWLLVSSQLDSAQNRLAAKQAQLQKLLPLYQQITKNSSQANNGNLKMTLIQSVLRNDLKVVRLLAEISQAIPSKITLNNITPIPGDASDKSYKKIGFSIKGTISSAVTATTELADFILELKKSPIISNVSLVYLGKTANTVDSEQSFEISCKLSEE